MARFYVEGNEIEVDDPLFHLSLKDANSIVFNLVQYVYENIPEPPIRTDNFSKIRLID